MTPKLKAITDLLGKDVVIYLVGEYELTGKLSTNGHNFQATESHDKRLLFITNEVSKVEGHAIFVL